LGKSSIFSIECDEKGINMVSKKKIDLNEIASLMGRKGGKAGTGKSKRRGNSSYYRDMQRKSVISRNKTEVKRDN